MWQRMGFRGGEMDQRASGDRKDQKEEGRRGDYTRAIRKAETVAPTAYVKAGLAGGVMAGVLFLALQVALNSRADVMAPFRMLASIFLAEAGMSESAPVGTIVLVGLLDNALVSGFWGVVFGLALACCRNGWAPGNVVTLGMLFGAAVWLLDFYLLAPLFWPWIHELSSVSLFIGHAFLFGLPLGIWVSVHTRK